MAMLECPSCGQKHDLGSYPVWYDGMCNYRFEFKCDECGETFDVSVTWQPTFREERRQPKEQPHDR